MINGSFVRPSQGETKKRQWDRCNDMVISWILSSVSEEISASLLYTQTAIGIWDELVQRFEQFNGAKLYEVEDMLNQTSQGSNSISAYFTKLKRLWEELRHMRALPTCTCGAHETIRKLVDERKVIKFLMGLNDSYGVVRGNILMMNPIPNINVVYSLLIQEEKQREISTPSPLNAESSAMAAKGWTRGSQGYNKNNNNGKHQVTGNSFKAEGNYQHNYKALQ
ncbi:uncharacterized protein LOC141648764 [Silene latifolia]|uniref:uncharacterized protein LOC141648764 n=1 Tax=Silene latifolia TaxID=37657 RepID=UPI003D78A8B9